MFCRIGKIISEPDLFRPGLKPVDVKFPPIGYNLFSSVRPGPDFLVVAVEGFRTDTFQLVHVRLKLHGKLFARLKSLYATMPPRLTPARNPLVVRLHPHDHGLSLQHRDRSSTADEIRPYRYILLPNAHVRFPDYLTRGLPLVFVLGEIV